jgi:predicted acetyltransferase
MNMDIAIKPVESAEELRMANHLLAGVHSELDPTATVRWLETVGASYPGFERHHTRVAFRKNELVGGLRLITDTIRLGEARLKMGGIGWVTTAARYRKKGICRLLMEDTLNYMRDHKYHVSTLYGIPDMYHRFGYVTTLADYSIVIDTMEALSFTNPFKVRQVKPGDIRAVQKLHNANDRETACSILRTAAHFSCRWDRCQGMRVLTDDQGKVVAYYIAQPAGDHLQVSEVAVAEPGLAAGLLGALGGDAEEISAGTVRVHAPPSHVFSRYLLPFKCRLETRHDRGSGGMMAFIDIAETLELMIPEWESRLSRSVAVEYRTEFTLIVDGAPYRIRSNRGAIDVANVYGKNKVSIFRDDLTHLVTGYRYPEDILEGRHCVMAGDARTLFITVFPKRCPTIWPFDRF